MKSKVLIFVFGLLLGGLAVSFLHKRSEKKEYVMLNSAYFSSNGSVIEKGTKLYYDQAFSEGFTRYIMYVNIEEQDKVLENLETSSKYSITPYWFEPVK